MIQLLELQQRIIRGKQGSDCDQSQEYITYGNIWRDGLL